jgi:hypothetical protein
VFAYEIPQIDVGEDKLRVDIRSGDGILEAVLLEILLQGLLLEGVAALHYRRSLHDFLNEGKGT